MGICSPGPCLPSLCRQFVRLASGKALGGGYEKWALKTKVEIIRKGQSAAFVVNVSKIETGKTNDVPIEPDDYIYVPRAKMMKLRDSVARDR